MNPIKKKAPTIQLPHPKGFMTSRRRNPETAGGHWDNCPGILNSYFSRPLSEAAAQRTVKAEEGGEGWPTHKAGTRVKKIIRPARVQDVARARLNQHFAAQDTSYGEVAA